MKRVAIIGAGASGLICAKVLLDSGYSVTVFEKTNNVAGVWNYSEQEGVLYGSLRTNLPKEIMIFENQEVDYESEESFVSYYDVKQYLENNARAWQIDKCTCLNSEVIGLIPLPNLKDKPFWQITYLNNNIKYEETFEFVVVCNGHYNKPKFPSEISGLSTLSQKYISHSKDYRSPNNYGKRVICVGYSSSGMDISQELYNSGREVYVSIRGFGSDKELYNLENKTNTVKFISEIQNVENGITKFKAITANGNYIEADNIILGAVLDN